MHGLARRTGGSVAAALVAAGLIALASVLSGTSFASAATSGGADGLSPSTVKVIQMVHQASVVELWAGTRAQRVTANPAIRWVGRSLITDHLFLDRVTEELAAKLGLRLPKEPTLQQQSGVRKMAREKGAAFDRAFANSLYFGHSVVTGIARKAQADLQRPGANPEVRRYVEMAVPFVLKHMRWLMATGEVTAAVDSTAAVQAEMAQGVSQTRTFSNVLPLVGGVGSFAVMVLLVWRRIFGLTLLRR